MDKKKTFANTLANMTSKIWSMVSIYLFVPLYIKYLGEEAYGLVSFFSTMQMALNLLGLGLSSTLRREFALNIDGGYEINLRKYKLLRSVEMFFSFIALFIIIICCCGSNIIATKWLDSSMLGEDIVSTTIGLMGVSIAFQLLAQLYFGAILGLAQQVLANTLNIIYAAIKAVGSLAIIIYIVPDIRAFYVWHIFMDLLYIVLLRVILVKYISKTGKVFWGMRDFWIIKDVWKYAAGLVIISLVAFVNRQLDRIVISKFMTLTELGAYNSCYTLGQIVTIISSAVATAVFSEFTNEYSIDTKRERVQTLYIKNYKFVVIIASAIGCFVAVYSNPLLLFWTSSSKYVEIMDGWAKLIILGTTVLAFQEIPYAFVLAQGDTSINRKMGLYCLLPFIFMMYFGVKYFGVAGAACIYFVFMAIQTFVYIYVIYRKYCQGNVIKWIYKDTLLPGGMALLLALFSWYLSDLLSLDGIIKIGFAIFTGIISLGIMFLLFARNIVTQRKKERVKNE